MIERPGGHVVALNDDEDEEEEEEPNLCYAKDFSISHAQSALL